MNLTLLPKLTQYNRLANQTICGYVLKAGETMADIEQPGSFPTVRKTLLHIWDAQFIWHSRLHGTSLSDFPSKSFKGNLADACDGLLNSSQQIINYAEGLNGNFDAVINYQTLDGKKFENTISDIILHCLNHSTYHRGQLINLLRGAGFTEVGSTDYMRFCRNPL